MWMRSSQVVYEISSRVHCSENLIYEFPGMKLCGVIPNSFIYVSVSDLYIPRIGLPIWLQQNRQTDPSRKV